MSKIYVFFISFCRIEKNKIVVFLVIFVHIFIRLFVFAFLCRVCLNIDS